MKNIAWVSVVLGIGTPVWGADEPPAFPVQPYAGVKYQYRVTADPAEQVHVAFVDLANPDVDVRVSAAGPDPDGDGPYQTILQVPSVIAAREHFEVTVNGDFFAARKTVDVEGEKSGYVSGKWATVTGPAVTDGVLWAPTGTARAALWLGAHKTPHIAMVKDAPVEAIQVIAGSHILVSGGKTTVETESSFSRTRHPRTAVGIMGDGHTLVLVVADGRRAGVSVGMSLSELAELMRQLGCQEALNLDGGGSTEMVARDPNSGELRVLNHPSDGRERAVANVLGISIRGSRRARVVTPPIVEGDK
ncbi:hypothetical protein IAD21_06229 [Abditibacteriota bacterium]|nr:hypothetical protein IAD21_06229 [Abditibacteriota bacterium]